MNDTPIPMREDKKGLLFSDDDYLDTFHGMEELVESGSSLKISSIQNFAI